MNDDDLIIRSSGEGSDGVQLPPPSKVFGRRLLPTAWLQDLCGMRVHLTSPIPGLPVKLGNAGYVGILVGVDPEPTFPKRARGLIFLSPAPMIPSYTLMEASTIEKCMPECVAPGSTDFRSMLEEDGKEY